MCLTKSWMSQSGIYLISPGCSHQHCSFLFITIWLSPTLMPRCDLTVPEAFFYLGWSSLFLSLSAHSLCVFLCWFVHVYTLYGSHVDSSEVSCIYFPLTLEYNFEFCWYLSQFVELMLVQIFSGFWVKFYQVDYWIMFNFLHLVCGISIICPQDTFLAFSFPHAQCYI